MLIGMQLKTRNGHMLKFREELRLTGTAAAEMADVSPAVWYALEGLRYDRATWISACKVSDMLGIHVEEIYPEECAKRNMSSRSTVFRRVDPNFLMAQRTKERLELPSPEESVELADEKAKDFTRLNVVLQSLSYREREILKRRFGLGGIPKQTLLELGREFGVTVERVRMIEAKAIRKMQHPVRAAKLVGMIDTE